MASKIEWTDETWNPVVGCSIVSPGCTNCYAMKMAGRLEAMGTAPHYAGTTTKTKAGPVWTGKIGIAPPNIRIQPLRWRRPRSIFVDSMGDLFHPDVPNDIIRMVFAIAFLTPQHTYQILTKRPDRMREFVTDPESAMVVAIELMGMLLTEEEEGQGDEFETALWDLQERLYAKRNSNVHDTWPLPNVILGTSVEDQTRADERREPMAAIAQAGWNTFVSYEPALGPVDWSGWEFIKWLIAGGESGADARPMHPDWARSARDFCAERGIAFLFKQWGAWKEAFHDQDGPKVSIVEGDDDAADAIMAMFAGRQTAFVSADGRSFHGHYNHLPQDLAWRMMVKAPKGENGRLLDGVEHKAMPEVAL